MIQTEYDVNQPIGKALELWLYRYKKNTVKPGSFERMLISLKMMNRYPLSSTLLRDACSDDMTIYINQLVRDGYALTTIKKQRNLLSGFYKWLSAEGVPVRQICKNAPMPSESNCKKKKELVEAFTELEQQKILKAAEASTELGADLAVIILETGMRIGEALALRWGDIRWQDKTLHIGRTIIHGMDRQKIAVQDEPKSFSSDRRIPLSRAAQLRFLQIMHRYDEVQHEGLIFAYQGDPTVCTTYSSACWSLKRFCKTAGVPYKSPHKFRHTFATNCYYKHCDVKVLSKFLGHHSVSVTYNTYIHLYGDAMEEMRNIINS